jgi:heme-degrading monooxygenase HmoA
VARRPPLRCASVPHHDSESPQFTPGHVVTVFRSRVRPEATAEYEARAAEMLDLAKTMPGLVDVKSFAADDGEHVTLATFTDAETQRAWREQADHRRAQRAGRDRFYAEYSVQVCECTKVRSFTVAGGRVSTP